MSRSLSFAQQSVLTSVHISVLSTVVRFPPSFFFFMQRALSQRHVPMPMPSSWPRSTAYTRLLYLRSHSGDTTTGVSAAGTWCSKRVHFAELSCSPPQTKPERT